MPPLGFDAIGGGEGLGLVAIGGGCFAANELDGREDAGVLFDDPVADPLIGFFQGAAEPLVGARPGKTATGLADTSAVTDFTEMTGTVGFEVDAGVEVVATTGAEGGGGRAGGGRAAGVGLVFGGTSSR